MAPEASQSYSPPGSTGLEITWQQQQQQLTLSRFIKKSLFLSEKEKKCIAFSRGPIHLAAGEEMPDCCRRRGALLAGRRVRFF